MRWEQGLLSQSHETTKGTNLPPQICRFLILLRGWDHARFRFVILELPAHL